MKYMLLIYQNEATSQARGEKQTAEFMGAYMAYTKAMRESGAYVAGDPLTLSSTATTVRVADGRAKVLNGPYAETKEQLGGYYIIDVADLDAATAWAARCPTAQAGGVLEVRPIRTM
ncbi:MAG: YciI family protein [Alphaproteobacteria bacterium]|nr:YciI family protein [Alphaproteobacteria bacterium]